MQDTAMDLAPKTTELLQANAALFGQPRLDAQDIKALKRRIASGMAEDTGISLARAIRILARNEPSEEVAKLLSDVLADPASTQVIRRRAAQGLGAIDSDVARDALHNAVRDADDDLLSAILRALANIGNRESLRVLDALRAEHSQHILDEAAFTRALLVHKTGVSSDDADLDRIAPKPRPVPLRTETAKTLGAVMKRLRGPTFGLALAETMGVSFVCVNQRHYVLLDKALSGRAKMANVLKRPQIVGAIVADQGVSEGIAVRQLIFSQPEKGGVRLSITSLQGAVLFLGEARFTDAGADIVLRDHTGSRLPTAIRGAVTTKSLEIEAEFLGGRGRRKRHGEQEPLVR